MMIEIDGSQGEGGGQVLRTSLALSMVTGRPFRIQGIRAGRPKPGLMRQHLTCVLAAAELCGANVAGAEVGAREISFAPGPIRSGKFRFQIGTAGGTALVLQAILPAMLRADAPSSVTIEGGTHNTAAPPFEFVQLALLPLLVRCGARIRARLERHGFYPAGGGRIVVESDVSGGTDGYSSLELLIAGARRQASATALLSRLSEEIGRRELAALRARTGIEADACATVVVPDPVGPGNALLAVLESEHVTEVFSAVGEHGKSAERVANEVSDQVREYLVRHAPVGAHLADQLMVPLAVMAGGRYRAAEVSSHARTNAEVMKKFGVGVRVHDDGVIEVDPIAAAFGGGSRVTLTGA